MANPVITANSSQLMTSLQPGLARGGTLLAISLVGSTPFDTNPLITEELSIRGWPSGTPIDAEESIDFAKHFGVECVVQKFPLEKVQEAYNAVVEGKARYRSVLVM